MNRALTVWWDDKDVGELGLNEHGTMTFRYAREWLDDPRAPAISVSLPKRADEFNRAGTRPFFAGLLPEEKPRTEAARALGVSQQNDFGLLEGLGGDVAGALTLWPRGQAAPVLNPNGKAIVQDEAALAAILENLPRRPLLAGEEGIRLSLAGAQPKVPVVLVDGVVALPAPGQPTTHIIKPAPTEYPTFPENEAFCMRLARELRLEVASVEIRQAGDQRYLLVERYDRVRREGVLGRLHQEDFCQALGVMPEHKYAAEQGPTFQLSFELLRRATRLPARAILRLIDAALFNLIIGNADAHGKNFSLLYAPEGPQLAPLYDLLSTSFYPNVHAKMAMRMGGAARLEEITPRALNEFAAQAGVAAPYVRRRALELARLAGPATVQVVRRLASEKVGTDAVENVALHVRTRSETLLALLEAPEASGTEVLKDIIPMTQPTGTSALASLDPLIRAGQFELVAMGIKAFTASEPRIGRYVANHLANRIYNIHPDFVAEKARLSPWLRSDAGWRDTISSFADDPTRLGGKVFAALESLKAFEPEKS